MRIGILSDTHGRIDRTQEAVRMLESLKVAAVLHCGDIGSAEIVRLLRGWPCHFVFGNVDDPDLLREAILEAGQTCHEWFGSLEVEDRKIALLHGDDYRRLRQTIASGQWDLVCHGHTHVADIRTEGRTVVVNPGALHRSARPSLAVVDLPSLKATPVTL
ncbi:MAG: YfcE family phosphodiesterase [Pirellulales bacterium]|nr:YfcE family phosphodiesterase [Pirellulales bacterium]